MGNYVINRVKIDYNNSNPVHELASMLMERWRCTNIGIMPEDIRAHFLDQCADLERYKLGISVFNRASELESLSNLYEVLKQLEEKTDPSDELKISKIQDIRTKTRKVYNNLVSRLKGSSYYCPLSVRDRGSLVNNRITEDEELEAKNLYNEGVQRIERNREKDDFIGVYD